VRVRVVACLLITVTVCLASACGPTAPGSASPSGLSGTITVFAASSLSAAFTTIGADFEKSHPGTMVKFSFAGSSSLAAQIQQGAIGDLFASADQPNMQRVVDGGLNAGAPKVFARNKLQIVVQGGNPRQIQTVADLAKPGIKFDACAPGVPCFRSDRVSTDAESHPIVYDRVFIPGDRFRITRQLHYDRSATA